jgi:hypothetical protein
MKYWNSVLNAPGSRKKNGQGKLSLAPNFFAAKLSFMPPLKPSVPFLFSFPPCFLEISSPVFGNLVRYVTKQGVLVLSLQKFWIKLWNDFEEIESKYRKP